MLLIWRGRGLWVLWSLGAVMGVAVLAFVVQKELGYPLVTTIERHLGLRAFLGGVLILLSGLPLIALAASAYRVGPQRYFEPESGRILLRRPEHSLYFLNVFWYGLAVTVGGLVLLGM